MTSAVLRSAVGVRPIRVLTNRPWLAGATIAGRPVQVTVIPAQGGWRARAAAMVASRYELAFVDCAVRELLLLCAVRRFIPFAGGRIVASDIVLTRPHTRADRLKFLMRRWLLGGVHRWVFYHRDTSEVRRVYRLRDERVGYVPFKANTRELLAGLPTADESFFLAPGRSNRDYRTLVEAFRGLPLRCVILAPWHDMGDERSTLDGVALPPNVSLASDDGTAVSWNDWIARATAVVLPIEPGALSPSGIGTYLVAMALRKAVVITDGPATRGLIDDGQAVVVPPRDVAALRAAIERLATDSRYREEIAAAGQRYADALGGEERLRADLLHELDRVARESS